MCDGKCIFWWANHNLCFFPFLWTHLLVDPMCTSGSGSNIMRIRRDCWGLGNSLRIVVVVVVVTVGIFFTLLKPNYINQLKTKVLKFFRLLRREHLKKEIVADPLISLWIQISVRWSCDRVGNHCWRSSSKSPEASIQSVTLTSHDWSSGDKNGNQPAKSIPAAEI